MHKTRSDRADYLVVAEEVAEALKARRPVVALESTIISHGMPFPRNLETARQVEEDVTSAGAVPATVAIIDGRFRIGLADEELTYLAKEQGVRKASRRDLASAFARRQTAATTVATTMIGADWAGIRVFATGGTGGVHRGASQTMDVSADLYELARTPVAVVSAGVKSILDIGKTLEYLETLGVPVLGYRTDAFPAFYTRDSGFPVTDRVDGPQEVAAILRGRWDSGLGGGVLVANPVPESAALAPEFINKVIDTAVAEADRKGITGKEVTPFLLGRIVELTDGRSLETNIALVRSNARVAGEIAVALVE
ncbi:MAG: pseudouridine-5'-phosphate glycosidase [Spirochaetota bacterium]